MTQHMWKEKKYRRAALLVTATNPDASSEPVKEKGNLSTYLHFTSTQLFNLSTVQ